MKTLIITNSKTIANIISVGLKAYGYVVEISISPTLTSVESLYRDNDFDYVIIDPNSVSESPTNKTRDLNLIQKDASDKRIIEKLSRIKKTFIDSKVIGLITSNSWQDRVKFLNFCGQDVISYPFAFQELLSRMQKLAVNKVENVNLSNNTNSQITLNINRRSIINSEQEIQLKTKEYALLEYLTRNRNRPISNSEIIDHVWEYNKITSNNTVAVHINKLRKKIKPYDLIKTVHGFGYRLEDKGNNVYISTAYDNNSSEKT